MIRSHPPHLHQPDLPPGARLGAALATAKPRERYPTAALRPRPARRACPSSIGCNL